MTKNYNELGNQLISKEHMNPVSIQTNHLHRNRIIYLPTDESKSYINLKRKQIWHWNKYFCLTNECESIAKTAKVETKSNQSIENYI